MNDKFWHCLPKTQFSDPFYLPEGRSNTMKGRSGEAEGRKCTGDRRTWHRKWEAVTPVSPPL